MKKILILLLIILIISGIFVNVADNYYSDRINAYVEKQADNLASNSIKDIVQRSVINNLDMNDILIIKYKEQKIETVIVNTKMVNTIMGESSELVDELLNEKYLNQELGYLELPMGMLFSKTVLSNRGPKIKIKMKPIGSYSTDVETKVNSFGINNSQIEVWLNIIIDVEVLIPLNIKNIKTITKIFLVSQVIQGTVPNYYYGNDTSVNYIPDNNSR